MWNNKAARTELVLLKSETREKEIPVHAGTWPIGSRFSRAALRPVTVTQDIFFPFMIILDTEKPAYTQHVVEAWT